MAARAKTNPSRLRPRSGPALARDRGNLARFCAGGAGLALGAAGAAFVPRLAGWLGSGVASYMLAAVAGLLLLVVAATNLVRLASEPGAVLRLFVGGPLAGALVGWLLWTAAGEWGWNLPAGVFKSLGLRWHAPTCVFAGAVVGWLAAALFDARDHVLAGAAAGVVPGAVIGLRGDWGPDAWFAAPVVAGLVMVLLVRMVLAAWALRWAADVEEVAMVLRGPAAFATIGAVLCGLAPSCARWLGERQLWPWLADFLIDLLALPGGIARLMGFEPGWLGGALAGALLGAFGLMLTTTSKPERKEGPEAYPLLELFAGAVLGLIDGYFGSPVLRAALFNWGAGAASGAIMGMVLFAALFDPHRLARVLGLVVIGAAAGAALWWLAQRAGAAFPDGSNLSRWWLPAPVGGIAAWLATRAVGPEMLQETDERGRGPEANSSSLLRFAGIGLLAAGYVFFPYAVRAVHAVRYLANGTVHAVAGRHVRAVAETTRAEKINPHSGWIYLVRSRANRELRQYDWAITDLSLLVERCVTPKDEAEQLLIRGSLYEAKKDYANSLRDYHTACKLHPTAEALARRGGALRDLKRLDLAEQDLRKALALDPDHAMALETFAWCLLDQAQPQAALEPLERVLALKPERAHAYYGRGWALLRMGEPARALSSFQAALRLEPQSSTYRLGVAWARHKTGDYQAAIVDATAAIDTDPANADAFDLRGRCYAALGQLDRALADYQQAARLDPSDPDPRMGMANVYRQRQDTVRATEADALAEQARVRSRQLTGISPERAAQVSQAATVEEIVSLLPAATGGP